MRAFVDAVETGFVTGGERNGAGLVDQPAEGEREVRNSLPVFEVRMVRYSFPV
jgi:hypothetical protein